MQKHSRITLSTREAAWASSSFTKRGINPSKATFPERPLHRTFGISKEDARGLDILMQGKPYSTWDGPDMQRAAAYVNEIYARESLGV